MSSRRRAAEACSFCRRRKIKCNNERPTCVNCKTYNQDCIYEPIDDPTKQAGRERHYRSKRRKALAKDTIQQKGLASPSSSHHEPDTTVSPSVDVDASTIQSASRSEAPDTSQQWPDRAPTRNSDASIARILVSANGVSSYHGRTSALFEDHAQERAQAGDTRPQMADDWVEKGLVAEAVRQRQMEELNFHQQKLDFDGVDPDLGMHLLSLHWNRQHHSFLITYRPAFMRDMACNGPYFSKLLLNAIYFGAAKFSPRLEVRKDPNDVRTAGWKYRERVRELLGGALDRSDVTTIQALLQMTNSLFALGDERSAAWLYSGLAFRMLIDLGMHVDLTHTHRFSDEDLEVRRRVFWGAFVVDKIQSLYQGRPASLKETDAVVPIKFLDTYEELEHWQPFAHSTSVLEYRGSPAYSTSTFTALCKLSLTMSDILSCIYTERSFDQSPTELSGMLEKLQLRLDKWQEGLPLHLQFDPIRAGTVTFPPPHIFSLHAMYNVLIILLYRPFVADGHLYNTSRSISVDSFMKCASAASSISNILRAYHAAFSIRRAPYLISYATYVAATILSRIAAKRGNDSTAHANLATCLAVFKENQETNFAVQKASMIIQNLMKRLGVVIEVVPSDALAIEALSKARDQDQARETAGNQSTANDAAEQGQYNKMQEPPETPLIGNLGYSPGSNNMEVDAIIQSFLQENEGNGSRPPFHNPGGGGFQDFFPQDGNAAMPNATMGQNYQLVNQPVLGQSAGNSGVPDAEGAYHESHWQQQQQQQQQGWRPGNGEIEDPLFGFHGSSTDSFPFTGMGW